MDNELNEQNNFIIYTTDDGQVDIEVRLEDENVWLTQNSMAELFDTTKQNISLHIKNIFEEKELDLLNRMVLAYLDVAEINALNMHAMTMKEWVYKFVIYSFLLLELCKTRKT